MEETATEAANDCEGLYALGKRMWYVLHVKPRAEKKVAQYLSIYRYFCHLPLYVRVTKVQRRKVRRELPLFPGYVFTKLFPDERIKMLQTNLLVRTIPVPHPRVMIHQLRQIARAAKAKPDFKPVNPCKVGDYVRVVYGAMRGTEGYIQRIGREASLCLNVDILGTAVEVAISPGDVIVIEKH